MAEAPAHLGEVMARARARLAAASETAGLDVRLLAGAAFGLDAPGLILCEQDVVDPVAHDRFASFVERRAAGEPVHRILGRRAFRDHEFALSADTLEPRPDTEALVDLAARALGTCDAPRPVFADLGTGTGAIAVSLLALHPQARCIAVDLSVGALETARLNAASAGVADRFQAVAGDYLEAFSGTLDLVVSNPPYIATEAIEDLAHEVRRFDPRLALDGGPDGLDAYRSICRGLKWLATRPPHLLFEIGAGQRDDVAAIAADAGYGLHEEARDLGGHVRALWFTLERGAKDAKAAFPTG